MIAVVDYGINETEELCYALRKLNINYVITRDEKEIARADKIIISNSSNIKKAIRKIHLFNLFSLLRIIKKPILGIALGMDLFCDNTDDGTACLGVIHSCLLCDTSELRGNDSSHMKRIKNLTDHKLFSEIRNEKFFFQDNFHFKKNDSTIAVLESDNDYSAAVIRENYFGVQFLPERSGEQGMKFIENFANLND